LAIFVETIKYFAGQFLRHPTHTLKFKSWNNINETYVILSRNFCRVYCRKRRFIMPSKNGFFCCFGQAPIQVLNVIDKYDHHVCCRKYIFEKSKEEGHHHLHALNLFHTYCHQQLPEPSPPVRKVVVVVKKVTDEAARDKRRAEARILAKQEEDRILSISKKRQGLEEKSRSDNESKDATETEKSTEDGVAFKGVVSETYLEDENAAHDSDQSQTMESNVESEIDVQKSSNQASSKVPYLPPPLPLPPLPLESKTVGSSGIRINGIIPRSPRSPKHGVQFEKPAVQAALRHVEKTSESKLTPSMPQINNMIAMMNPTHSSIRGDSVSFFHSPCLTLFTIFRK
jgi:hypothetical protein